MAVSTTPEGEYDFGHLFVRDSAVLAALRAGALEAVTYDALFWISYPKRSARLETDLTRDVLWAKMADTGWRPVAQVSIDDVWSAMRFARPRMWEAEAMTLSASGRLWLGWVAANSLGEMVGLGTTFAVGVGFYSLAGEPQNLGGALAFGAVMVATGAIEGTVVGLAQWLALRQGLPAVPRRAWVGATVVGALVAWFLGSLPSTLMSLGAEAGAAPAAEPEAWLVYLLAGLLGLVAGAVLALPQWWVLRRAVRRAGWWLPANSAAWFAGMPLIFALIDGAQRAATPVVAVLLMAAGLAAVGAIVGAIHGWVLVRLAYRLPS